MASLINHGFWAGLKKPIFALAPLANVTDAAFRRIIAKYGKPDVMYTEFISADGLCSKGKDRLMVELEYTEAERPIVAQFFGAKPENFFHTAKLAHTLGFDGIDINMGCPDKTVCKHGEGAALIKNPELAKEIIIAAKEGSGGLPVSVKTRTGYNRPVVDEWIGALLQTHPALITLHGRTKKEMSKVKADWQAIGRAAAIAKGSGTLIMGNGDCASYEDALLKIEQSGVDGIMFGRAIFGNPWFFNRTINREDIPLAERMQIMLEHAKLFEKIFGDIKNFITMRKHFNSYGAGFKGAKELRILLNQANSSKDLEEILKSFFSESKEAVNVRS